ncbi:MAG TPA: type 1 glutamine amidotransferase [Mycobacteriales bacterium]|nr:type 1 glutamine amidotransferase [Mycobacteriales bacterium]
MVQHTAHEGLGNLLQWLPAVGLDVHPIHPYLGHRVPPSVEGDALIVLGGPMGAYDDAEAPWLPATRELLSTAIDDGVPTLGICLGAQMLAVAAGGEVRRGDAGPELGLGNVDVPVGDQLLTAGSMPVVQWHYDAVTRLPDGAELLASSDAYRVQAFRVGDVAWGLQFHVEATPDMVAEWAREDGVSDEVADPVRAADDALRSAGDEVARRFASVVIG